MAFTMHSCTGMIIKHLETSELASVHGGDLQGFAKLGNDSFAAVGDAAQWISPKPGPMTHFNNRGADFAYYGEVAGRYADKFLGRQSDTEGTPKDLSPRQLSGWNGHLPSFGWKSF